MSLLAGVARYLAVRGHGTYSTTVPYGPDDVGIVLGHLPATPARCVGLAVYPSPESNSNEPYDLQNVQIRVRGTTDYEVSAGHAQAIYDDLHGLGPVDLPGGVHLANSVGNQGGPIYIGTDRNDQHEHAVNVRIEWLNATELRPDE